MDPKFNKNGILPSFIDIIYSIDHLFSAILDLDRGKLLLSTEQQFINFLSIIHCFQIETKILQDLAW